MDQNMKQRSKSSIGIIIALMVGYSMIYMDKGMIGLAIRPIAEQFGLDTSQTGLIMSLFFLGYSIFQIPGGWLADKLGAKRVLLISLAIMASFSYIFGAVSGLPLFLCIRFMQGVGHAGYPSSCSKSVAENFSKDKRTIVQSLMLSTSGIGGVLAYTLAATLIANNWRHAYVVLGSVYLLGFFLVLLFLPNVKSNSTEKKAQNKGVKFSNIITDRNVIVLFIAMLLINFQLYGNMSWLPSYLSDKFSLTTGQAGMFLVPNAIMQTLATLFAGALVSKLFLGKESKVIIACAIASAVFIVGFIQSGNIVLSIILLMLTNCAAITIFTTIFTWPHKLFEQTEIGSAIGIVNTGGTMGGFLAPMILGFLIKNTGGYETSFIFLAIASIVCGLMMLLIRKKA